ncbi:hypothetical protein C0993_010909 [Termitomyces sp. T159_Od127]|nr:hypothetical protein C0993_010909 [Termitomyces sp. T159_Od127]
MQKYPSVHNAVVLLIKNALWGFVTPANVPIPAVHAATACSLPSYAVPALDHFVTLREFPLTWNGKVDKHELYAIVEHTSKDKAAVTAGACEADMLNHVYGERNFLRHQKL